MNNKKGQSHVWWIIITALVAIIVAVVVLMMFSRGTSSAESAFSACESTGGQCVDVGACRNAGGSPSLLFQCKTIDGRLDPDKECCLAIKKTVDEN